MSETDADPLASALRELQRLRALYADQQALWNVFAEVDKVLARGSRTDPRAKLLSEAVECARSFERRGLDRQTAVDRAHVTFGIERREILDALRKTG